MHRSFVIISIAALLTFSCEKQSEKSVISGNTQGTTYSIIVPGEQINFNKKEIDSVLNDFDLALSTYIDNSVVSKLNNASDSIWVQDKSGYFKRCYELSQTVFQKSQGSFDPTVFPLIDAYGFFKNEKTPPSDAQITAILEYVGFEENKLFTISFSGDSIRLIKKNPNLKFDFNAIAQGLSVDVLAKFIESKGHEDYYVEIGGEIFVKGKNPDGEKWRIGIDTPSEENMPGKDKRSIDNVLMISGKAVATSGNYRKFYSSGGKKFSHTLDPLSGKAVNHSLLSATVIAENCAIADAYATVFMVLGLERSKSFLADHPKLKLDVYLISSGEDETYNYFISPGLGNYLEANN